MSKFYDDDVEEHPVQKDCKEGYSGENECFYPSEIINLEEEEEEYEENEDDDEEDTDEEDTDEEDTENENEESDDDGSRSSDNWEDNPHLEFIDVNQHEIFWHSEEEDCNINSFEDFFFSLNGIGSLNDLRGFSGMNEQNNRFVMLGDSLASGGAYEYHNRDGSYYSQRADGSIIRIDKFGRKRVTPPEENPRMGRRYHPY